MVALPATKVELNSPDRDRRPAKPKMFTIWPFIETFALPFSREKIQPRMDSVGQLAFYTFKIYLRNCYKDTRTP